jgi:hypothetical protein
MSTLVIQKCRYSRAPWRIGLLHPDGAFQELSSHLCFDRKRDAVPILTALQALAVPWDLPPEQCPADLKRQVWEIVQAAPGYQDWCRAVARSRVTGPGG